MMPSHSKIYKTAWALDCNSFKQGLTVSGEIDLKMHAHLLEADFGKLRIWRPTEVSYGYVYWCGRSLC